MRAGLHVLATLALVRMFGELLQSGRVESDEKRRQYLSIIVSESERLGSLIENVLDFAKVERGKQAYEFVERNVGEVVYRAVEACRVRAERDSVSLEYEADSALPVVPLDERAVEIAVINLVDNSVEALASTRDGMPASAAGTIAVQTLWDEPHRLARLVVADDGPGLGDADRSKLFLPYYSTKGRDSGLGLAIVRRIVVEHGGTIEATDRKPHGAAFTMEIPA